MAFRTGNLFSGLGAIGVVGRTPQRWARLAAWGCLFAVLPSVLWRVVMLSGVNVGFKEASFFRDGGMATGYVLALDAAEVLGAILCVGLVQHWGEVLPSWVPGLGGRRIHRLVPVVLGGLAAVLLTATFAQLLWRFTRSWLGATHDWTPADGMVGWQRVVLGVAYAPLFCWPVLLTIALVGYWLRRSAGARAPRPAR